MEDYCIENDMVAQKELAVIEESKEQDLLLSIVQDIKKHDCDFPEHRVGCICMDAFARKLRLFINSELPKGTKSRKQFDNILWSLMQ